MADYVRRRVRTKDGKIGFVFEVDENGRLIVSTFEERGRRTIAHQDDARAYDANDLTNLDGTPLEP